MLLAGDFHQQHVIPSREVLVEVVRSLGREGHGGRAVKGFVVRCMRASERLRDTLQAGLGFQSHAITLGRRQRGQIDQVERHRDRGRVVVQVVLNALLAVEGNLGGKGLAGEVVLRRDHGRVVEGPIGEAHVETGLDGARSSDIVGLAR